MVLSVEGTIFSFTYSMSITTISSSLTCGLDSGEYMPWFASGYGAELPDNQIIDDSESLVFDSNKLKNNYVILS